MFFFVLFFFCEFHRNLSQANLKAHYSTKILWYLRENPKNQIWISCHNLKLVRLGYEIYLTGHWLGFQSDFLGLKLGSFEISYVWLECLFKSIKNWVHKTTVQQNNNKCTTVPRYQPFTLLSGPGFDDHSVRRILPVMLSSISDLTYFYA